MIRIPMKFTGPQFDGSMMRIVEAELGSAMKQSLLLLETEIARNTPVNFGILRAGIVGTFFSPYRGIVGIAGPGAIYGPVVEMGRRPGRFPPVDAIRLWVKRKLKVSDKELKSVSFLVARKIARKGFKGAFMFKRGEKKMRKVILTQFRLAGNRIERRLSG